MGIPPLVRLETKAGAREGERRGGAALAARSLSRKGDTIDLEALSQINSKKKRKTTTTRGREGKKRPVHVSFSSSGCRQAPNLALGLSPASGCRGARASLVP